ncbi:GNAT family N-acetyltransferase [Anaeromicropila herbilytica]|uniref:N-acetyltransferase n=1 Tax=Anaeromicropila herbilytica TaxID=2785025 RepID=A0A7R7EL29_9FIRM|nr:GNAT family N-acetyltransferase [Anaeromicropila herbilytica]BCN30759.1 N-acetyltransferase [Anaeromicropila herbilytica]
MRNSMNIEIRECNIEDARYIYELNRDEMEYDYPFEQTIDKLERILSSKNDKVFVAIIQDIVVGYVHANDYDVIYTPHMKNIMGIAVSSKYKGNGIGKALLTEVENWAKETGAYGIRLVSGEERSGAHEFYRHCGYIENKRQINFKKIVKN